MSAQTVNQLQTSASNTTDVRMLIGGLRKWPTYTYRISIRAHETISNTSMRQSRWINNNNTVNTSH